ncbi:MAG: NAD-dependent epimerase/dehydratase family protein [Sphingobacteriales bacterium JAD_PAG50586_3]|nr:MAG: NAD-dependent epimerase/dehydratase family protein [Sphingobacteriales bacterium JAD_PAG50586_3]
MVIAVTGASGFIGSLLVSHLAQKHTVIALKRRLDNTHQPKVEERLFDLTKPETFENISGADALVHCAYIEFSPKNKEASTQNIEGTLALANLCKEKGMHFIFLSSMSAHADALSEYGKHKFAIERKLSGKGQAIIRPGLVVGDTGGLYNNIKNIIAKSSIIPLIGGGNQPIQIVHVDQLCSVIEQVAVNKTDGFYTVATPRVYTMKELYNAIAAGQSKKIRFINLPFGFMKFTLSIAEAIGLNLPIKTENLNGLKQLRSFNTKPDLEKLGVELRGWRASKSPPWRVPNKVTAGWVQLQHTPSRQAAPPLSRGDISFIVLTKALWGLYLCRNPDDKCRGKTKTMPLINLPRPASGGSTPP